MTSRFEIVQTDADQPWHARFIAANGEPIWTTESYADRSDAVHAVELLVEAIGVPLHGAGVVAMDIGVGQGDHPFFTIDGTPASPMLYPVDERAEATP
jgi:uncharacterized protein YegP (UPF0339 family)